MEQTQGWNAFREGRPNFTNPYPKPSALAALWDDGWFAAFRRYLDIPGTGHPTSIVERA